MKKPIGIIGFFISLPLWAIDSIEVGASLEIEPNGLHIAGDDFLYGGVDKTNNTILSLKNKALYLTKHGFYNKIIAGVNGKGKQFNFPLIAGLAFHAQYRINMIFLRTAFSYGFLITGTNATITPKNGKKDVISFSAQRAVAPITAGFNFSPAQGHYFYFGIGPTFAYANIKIEHSRVSEFQKVLPLKQQSIAYKSFLYESSGLGWNLYLGIQIPLTSERFSLQASWLYYEVQTELAIATIQGQKDSTGEVLPIKGHLFNLGVLYIIHL